MMSGILSDQQHLGPLVAGAAGLAGVDTATAEACCGAGGAALRWGCMAIASGYHETVVVVGTEVCECLSMLNTFFLGCPRALSFRILNHDFALNFEGGAGWCFFVGRSIHTSWRSGLECSPSS